MVFVRWGWKVLEWKASLMRFFGLALCLNSSRGIHSVISLANYLTPLGRPLAVCAAAAAFIQDLAELNPSPCGRPLAVCAAVAAFEPEGSHPTSSRYIKNPAEAGLFM